MTKLTLTPKQIQAIFDAGYNRGQSEASAFEWGCRASGKREDDLIDIVVEVANELGFHDEVTFEEVKKWFEEENE
jgi:hypothetical protein